MIKNVEYIIFQIFLFLVLFLQVSNVAAVEEPAEQWNRSFGGNGEDSAWCIQQTSEGGYIVAGTTASYGKGTEGCPDAWLIKVDKSGNMQWNKTYGGTYFDGGYFTRQTSDGGYVLSGYTFPSGYGEPWLIKTDKNGNKMWDKISDNITHEDYLQYRAERTFDGGYIVGDMVEYEVGSEFDLLIIDADIRLTKYDINGIQQWNNTFGKKNSSETLDPLLSSAKQAPNGGYVVASEVNLNETNSNYDIWLIKTDEYGQEQWNKTFGGPLDDSAFSLSVTSDDGYLLTGRYTEFCSYGTEGAAFILKTDSEGNQEWMKIFSNCTLYSVQQTSDGGYVAAGVKNGNAWLVKLANNREGTEYEGGKNTESDDGKDTDYESGKNIESANGESVGYGSTSESLSTQIRHYICDIFRGVFQWDYYT
ncbi:hypothetical protein MSKOL_1559 [Methanosarcina sp. Kolksee]|uniref:Cell surface protein n=1 Tax=Methanosarcina vacuolata Z-761 TaxID=1434123 RepID=A0A0E3Q5E4_9EURY|nr:hypothetical protein MSVAZ_1630 [Methanosarcina vacuolata Z-761]AKB47336.1 hypothetical protein MSKOL_1559 [Methanosarcina sp. Kolksee]